MDQQLGGTVTQQNDPVLIFEHVNSSGFAIGHAQLNVEGTLNSLSLEMIRRLAPVLTEWSQREDIAAVVITAVGEKAFCAGGDIQALYRAIDVNLTAGETIDSYPFDFFAEEYRLDYLIHTYPKPIVTLGHGIVMGGGLGILGASQYRVLTERSRLALPEVTIGLFPDAGASWAFRNMQKHHAGFLGLTGSHLNATDALLVGLGTHVISHSGRVPWLRDLFELPWRSDSTANEEVLTEWLAAGCTQEASILPDSELVRVPERDVDCADLVAEASAIYALAGTSQWIDRGIGNLKGGCPTTAGIVLEQIARVADMTLAESFQMELTVATHCAQNTDFHEGVRALIIDKDFAPKWKFGSIENLSKAHVLSHFEPPWTVHPLADLG